MYSFKACNISVPVSARPYDAAVSQGRSLSLINKLFHVLIVRLLALDLLGLPLLERLRVHDDPLDDRLGRHVTGRLQLAAQTRPVRGLRTHRMRTLTHTTERKTQRGKSCVRSRAVQPCPAEPCLGMSLEAD